SERRAWHHGCGGGWRGGWHAGGWRRQRLGGRGLGLRGHLGARAAGLDRRGGGPAQVHSAVVPLLPRPARQRGVVVGLPARAGRLPGADAGGGAGRAQEVLALPGPADAPVVRIYDRPDDARQGRSGRRPGARVPRGAVPGGRAGPGAPRRLRAGRAPARRGGLRLQGPWLCMIPRTRACGTLCASSAGRGASSEGQSRGAAHTDTTTAAPTTAALAVIADVAAGMPGAPRSWASLGGRRWEPPSRGRGRAPPGLQGGASPGPPPATS
ncbi:unnamed protein product, partial [Prorocentrum cordatum]